MPAAIATTKRKFYKALDSLNTAPATRPVEPTAKRVRRSVSTNSTIPRTHATTGAPSSDYADDKQPPNFSPWSHETFLARLKTFSSVSLWHPKPEAISEVEWAKRGWICVGVNTVACKGGCEKRVVVDLEYEVKPVNGTDNDASENEAEDGTSSMEEALVSRYRGLIAHGHSDTCMWRRAGCKNDIYRLQVVRPSIWQPELRSRHGSLLTISDSTRAVKLRTSLNVDQASTSSKSLFEQLPPDLLGESDATVKPDDSCKALEITMYGWRGSHNSGTDLLHCDACFQRIGLWMYQPDYKQTHSSSDDESEDTATIDLLEMHREHCPWRNADTQQASGSLTGLNACQILRQMMANYVRECRRRSSEQAKTLVQPDEAEHVEEDASHEGSAPPSPAPSRAEVVQQDKERESRLRRLKRVFTVKRRAVPAVKQNAVVK